MYRGVMLVLAFGLLSCVLLGRCYWGNGKAGGLFRVGLWRPVGKEC